MACPLGRSQVVHAQFDPPPRLARHAVPPRPATVVRGCNASRLSHQQQHRQQSIVTRGTITTNPECIEQVYEESRTLSLPSAGFLEPSYDLRLLCTKQLETIYEILRRSQTAAAANSIRSTIYVRSPEFIDSNGLALTKVVSLFPEQSPHAYCDPSSDDDNLLHLAAPDGNTSVEAFLLKHPTLLLPNTPTAVLPLAHHGTLVGLLVLERHLGPADQRAWSQADNGAPPVFSEEELWLFSTTTPPLAHACHMSLRSAMAAAESSARQQRAAALVHGAQGSVRALRTFGSMLLPRLHEGQPDRDLASNMVVQSKQLEEVVQQLEAALRPDPPPPGPGSIFAPPLDADPPIRPLGSDYPPFYPFHPASSTPYSDTRVPLPPPSSTPSTFSHPTLPYPPPQPPAFVDLSSSPPPRSAAPPSPRTPPALTIQREHRPPLSIPSPPSDSPHSDTCLALLPPEHSASDGTITMDLDEGHLEHPLPNPPSRAAAGPPSTSAPAAAPAECNVADALVNILTAAVNLCKARGVQAIICHPLRTHTRPGSRPPATPRPSAYGDVPQLLPRPTRPLRAAVPAAMVAQAVSYVLEVVLASCNKGGLVGVYAHRTTSPPWGIQLIVLFTGTVRMVTGALAAEWQRALGAEERGAAGAWGGAGGAAGGAGNVAGVSSLELAQGLLQRVGGRISITYPCKLKSKLKQTVEAGTCVEVWLPAASNRPEGGAQ